MLFTDNGHQTLEFEVRVRGYVSGTSVHPSIVVRRALVHNTTA